jgi:hypothetical protein
MALIEDMFENTAAFDFAVGSPDTFKVALYDNDITPDQTVTSANTAYAVGQWAVSGNEVTDGTNWDTGGEPLTGVTSTRSSNVYTVDATDTPQSGASCTLANVYGGLVYDDTLASPVADQGVSYHYFGGAQSVTAGTFTVVWHGSGILAITA